MSLHSLFALGAILIMGLVGCAPPVVDAIWPEPRPLGHALPVYTPPVQPPTAVDATPAVPTPTGALTLPQVQALALRYNPDLAAVGWDVRTGEARTLQAHLSPNPEASLEVENVGGTGALRGVDATEITLFLSQEIEVAGKREKRARVAALERDLSAWDYEAMRLDVLLTVTQAFVDVLSAQARLAQREELVRLSEQVAATVAERVKSGKVAPVEDTRARVALAQSRIALERVQREHDGARQRLVAVWGGDTPTFERVEGNLQSVPVIPTADQVAAHLSQNPALARWVTVMAQRQAAVHLERARRTPNPTIGGGWRYGNETSDHTFVAAFTLPLPLFDRNQGNLLAARYQLAKAAEERRAMAAQVRAALGETYGSLAAAFATTQRLHREVLPGAQDAFAAIREGYRQGKFGFLEVLDAQRTLFEVNSQYIEALAAYHRAVAAVERLIGTPLTAVTNTARQ